MFPGQLHKNCIIGGATGISLFGIYATYNYTHAKALKAENKNLKQELYELKRQKWMAENTPSEPDQAINKYDSYDLTDEANTQYASEKVRAPKLVLSELPPLNMISEDEREESVPASVPTEVAETSSSEDEQPTAPVEQPASSAAVPAATADSASLYRPESCTCQTPRNVIIGMIDLFVLASAIYIYIFTSHLHRHCPT